MMAVSMMADSRLCKVKILARNDSKGLVKVHFVGYNRCYDQWMSIDELERLPGDESLAVQGPMQRSQQYQAPTVASCGPFQDMERVSSFDFNQELASRIKSRLKSSTKENPQISIKFPFDELIFKGGLGQAGIVDRHYRHCMYYKIRSYKDLNWLLGKNWHIRGINDKGDFCYVICHSVRFHLKQMKPIIDFRKDGEDFKAVSYSSSKSLVFTFVCGDGVEREYRHDIAYVCKWLIKKIVAIVTNM